MKKLLIANRGEIALRIINTAHNLNIPTLALVTAAERQAEYARLADEVVEIGEGPSSSSFLDHEKIINVALQKNADSIHPGYGFLSENLQFVTLAEQSGIKFVGPDSGTMHKMAAKDVAKQIMTENDIPVTPGHYSDNQDPDFLLERAREIGFPVIIKAVMGGGGKGMRVVTQASEFHQMLASCKIECKNAFGDDRVLIERYIADPKHIEVQILADAFGNTFHFFERDCSIQRRHQKIIEEAPSNLRPEVVAKIREVAVRAARCVNYENAGTVEFLVDKDSHDFFFMEMNTRLQVEHPVSEMITGHDLLELQLRVAMGENLKGLVVPEEPLGHSIEARICAEDPFNGFLPSTGKVQLLEFDGQRVDDWDGRRGNQIPQDVYLKRLDSGVVTGSQITQFYDSMIGKLIVHGDDRASALSNLKAQLQELKILGVQTNVPFILNLFDDQDFLDYNYSLKYFENKQGKLLVEKSDFNHQIYAWALQNIFPFDFFENQEFSYNFRNNATLQKQFRLRIKRALLPADPSDIIEIRVFQLERLQNKFRVEIWKNSEMKEKAEFEVLSRKKNVLSFVNLDKKEIFNEKIYSFDNNVLFNVNGAFYEFIDATLESFMESSEQETGNIVKSPMPGTITNIYYKEGDVVEEGEILMTIEAMKMENKVYALKKMKLTKVNCAVQQYVDMGQELIETEEAE